jgi:hypothetical protein
MNSFNDPHASFSKKLWGFFTNAKRSPSVTLPHGLGSQILDPFQLMTEMSGRFR